jgi:hypothetical protein
MIMKIVNDAVQEITVLDNAELAQVNGAGRVLMVVYIQAPLPPLPK